MVLQSVFEEEVILRKEVIKVFDPSLLNFENN